MEYGWGGGGGGGGVSYENKTDQLLNLDRLQLKTVNNVSNWFSITKFVIESFTGPASGPAVLQVGIKLSVIIIKKVQIFSRSRSVSLIVYTILFMQYCLYFQTVL